MGTEPGDGDGSYAIRRHNPPMPEGLTSAGIERLHAAAARHVGATRVPGLVVLVARGAEVHVEALGNLTVGGLPVARDSIFGLSSTTRPITAAAYAALA
jgi:CubicO group peptidase (beta-lactamase class C family)